MKFLCLLLVALATSLTAHAEPTKDPRYLELGNEALQVSIDLKSARIASRENPSVRFAKSFLTTVREGVKFHIFKKTAFNCDTRDVAILTFIVTTHEGEQVWSNEGEVGLATAVKGSLAGGELDAICSLDPATLAVEKVEKPETDSSSNLFKD